MDEVDVVEEELEEEIVLATVSAVTANGVKITIDGNEEPGEKEYNVNAAQKFDVGDRVKIHKDSGTYLIEYVIGSPMSKYPLPSGGSNGQVLTKSGTNPYVVTWSDVPHELPSGGSDGQVLTKDGANNYVVKWANVPHELPSGGSQDQILTKKSGTDYDVQWSTKGFVPSGGTANQILSKRTSTNYDVQWINPTNVLPSAGTTGQVLKKNSNTNYDVGWGDVPHELPSGGTNGQYLVKDGANNYVVKWANAPTPTSLTNGSYTVSCANNGYLYPSSGNITLGASNAYWNGCYIKGAIRLGDGVYSSSIGFFGTTPQTKKTVGSSGTLAQLITALQGYGLIA